MARLEQRILDALRADSLHESQLADLLFVDRRTLSETLFSTYKEGKLHRRYAHTNRQRPDYLWSTVSLQVTRPTHDSPLDSIAGDWDAIDIRKWKA